MNAREEMLGRIAAAHRAAPPPDLPYGSIERRYRTSPALAGNELVEVPVDRLLDYKALVRRTTPDALAATIAEGLRERGIGHKAYYRVPVHLQPAMAAYGEGYDLPVTAEVAASHLAIPMSAVLTREQADEVVGAVREAVAAGVT